MRSLVGDPAGNASLQSAGRGSRPPTGSRAHIAAPAAAARVQVDHPGVRWRSSRPRGGPVSSAPASTLRWWSASRQVHRAQAIPPGGLLPGVVRIGGTTWPSTAPGLRHRRLAAPTGWSTSSNRCCRSTNSTWPPASRRGCGSRSPRPTSSSTSRRPGRQPAWACCPASWPISTPTWSGYCPTQVTVQLTYWLVDPRRDAAPARGGGQSSRRSVLGCAAERKALLGERS